MKSIEIAIKNKTNLTVQLEKKYDVSYHNKQTFFKKLFSKERTPNLYIHQGLVNQEALELAQKSEITIVNANCVKSEFLEKNIELHESKIQVIYPYYVTKVDYNKEIKKEFKKKYKIDKQDKIIFFRGKDLAKSGMAVLFDMISRMYEENFTLVIESNAKQIIPLRINLERAKSKLKYLLLEDYENMDELFIASDIFILPTFNKTFATDVVKAMHFKNAVFVMEENASSEILDVFSYIQGAQDRSLSFKVDSLLMNKDELKNIQKANCKKVKKFTLENTLAEIINLLEN